MVEMTMLVFDLTMCLLVNIGEIVKNRMNSGFQGGHFALHITIISSSLPPTLTPYYLPVAFYLVY